jgi:RNA-directed DNA polymerase
MDMMFWKDSVVLSELDSIKRRVYEVQKLVFEAKKRGDTKEVLHRSVMLMQSIDARVLAVYQTTASANSGANIPGMDGVVWNTDESKIAALDMLGIILKNISEHTPGKFLIGEEYDFNTGMIRNVKYPNIIDRALIYIYMMVTLPIVECDSDRGSFAPRPGRSTHEAIHVLNYRYGNMHGEAPNMYYHVNLKKCFEDIQSCDRNVFDHAGPFSALVIKWLDNGMLVESSAVNIIGIRRSEVEMVSNIIYNGTLNGRGEAFKSSCLTLAKCVDYVRCADDIVVVFKDESKFKEVETVVAQFIEIKGINLNYAVVNIEDILKGLAYLGWDLQRRMGLDGSTRNKYGKPNRILKPSYSSVKLVKSLIIKETNKVIPRGELITNLNNRRVPWCLNFASSYNSRDTMNKRDSMLRYRIDHWYEKKNPDSKRQKSIWSIEQVNSRFTPLQRKYKHPQFVYDDLMNVIICIHLNYRLER